MIRAPKVVLAAVLLVATLLATLATGARAAEAVRIAVAANFANTMRILAEPFESASGIPLKISVASTGVHFAQILNGAPFDVFLAADQVRPQSLIEKGFAVAGSRFTYAIGRLVMWSRKRGLAEAGARAVRRRDVRRIAIANPSTAPYGAAARDALTALGMLGFATPKFVQGNSVGQAMQFALTGNADIGFVALSQVIGPPASGTGFFWRVPFQLHQPLNQDAVLLSAGADNPGAALFLEYLRSLDARQVISARGYFLPDN